MGLNEIGQIFHSRKWKSGVDNQKSRPLGLGLSVNEGSTGANSTEFTGVNLTFRVERGVFRKSFNLCLLVADPTPTLGTNVIDLALSHDFLENHTGLGLGQPQHIHGLVTSDVEVGVQVGHDQL